MYPCAGVPWKRVDRDPSREPFLREFRSRYNEILTLCTNKIEVFIATRRYSDTKPPSKYVPQYVREYFQLLEFLQGVKEGQIQEGAFLAKNVSRMNESTPSCHEDVSLLGVCTSSPSPPPTKKKSFEFRCWTCSLCLSFRGPLKNSGLRFLYA